MTRSPRPRIKLSDPLQERLNMYALSAGAAGVGMLALAPVADAEIIYTKTHSVIGRQGVYPLDLRNDGTVNFAIAESSQESICGTNALLLFPAYGNAVANTGGGWVAALRAGARIGNGQQFRSTFGLVMAAYECGTEGSCGSDGKWVNVSGRYLGLKFQIRGKTHYGWARLSVVVGKACKITATLTGYAYETIAGESISAGQTGREMDEEFVVPETAGSVAATSFASEPSSANAPSLGSLALGSESTGRRRP